MVFRAKGALAPKSFRRPPPLPPQNKRRRGGRSTHDSESDQDGLGQGTAPLDGLAERRPTSPLAQSEGAARQQRVIGSDAAAPSEESEEAPAQLTLDEVAPRLSSMVAPGPEVDPTTGTLYCPECYLPLHPDPKPETLYIFLHALTYELSLGRFETEMPEWAKEGWEWER